MTGPDKDVSPPSLQNAIAPKTIAAAFSLAVFLCLILGILLPSITALIIGALITLQGFSTYWIARVSADRRTVRREAPTQAEEQLRLSESRYRASFEVANVGKMEVDAATGRFTLVNDAYCRIVGWPREELLQMRPFDLIHHEDRQWDSPAVTAFFRGETDRYSSEKRFVRKDGQTVWVRVNCGLVRDSHGKPLHSVGVLEDITQRKQAEEGLRQSEERLASVLRASPVGIALLDRDLRFLHINDALAAMNDLPAADHIGRTLRQALGDKRADLVEYLFRQVLETGKPVLNSEVTARINGNLRAFLAQYFPIRDRSTGSLTGVSCVVADISQRKQMEEALALSQERLRSALQAAEVGTWCIDLLTMEDTRDANLNRILGLPPLESTTPVEDFLARIHPEDRPRCEAAWHRALTGNNVYDMINRIVRPNGETRWVRDRGQVVCDGQNKPIYMVGALVDITERKLAEDAVRVSEERFRRAADATNALVYEVELHGETKAQAYGLERLIGDVGIDQELTSDWWHSRIASEDLPAHMAYLESCLADPNCHSYRASYRVQHNDGSWRHVEDTASILRTAIGKPERLVGTILDVTERKHYEEALKEADRQKDEFLATLAHELRNPLAPIRNGLALMKLAQGNAEAVEQAREMMDRQLGQMVRLIDDLLDLSRISRGKIVLQKRPLSLSAAVQDAIDMSRPLIKRSGHELNVEIPDTAIIVDADETRLTQIFTNILNNAAKYTEPGGQIHLSVAREGNDAVIRVKDTGVGIPEVMLPHVFDMFTQVDRSLERSQGGLGIGLNIVKRLTEMHGGTIVAESEGQGKGTQFTVRLPLVLPPRIDSHVSIAEECGQAVQRRRILVVDDNHDAAISLAMMLQFMGHDTRLAHDGLEALDAATHFLPEIVFLDIGMPKLNGYEACKRIREEPWGKELLLIALTGWGQEEDRRRSNESGFDIHLVKPIDPAALSRILESHSMHDRLEA